MPHHDDIAANLAAVRARILAAALAAGRPPADIRLLAVSKMVGLDRVRAAAAAGQVDFGENRVQEALQKMHGSADLTIRWHLIGTLQTNKARRAASRFDVIHSVDSLRLLEAIDAAAVEAGTSPQVLVQVDLAGEATKHGAPPAQARELVKAAAGCRAARLTGLMTIPPYFDDPEQARPFFRELGALRASLVREGADPGTLRDLSMGMSHDFHIAVQEGATIVRLGTAIFGERGV